MKKDEQEKFLDALPGDLRRIAKVAGLEAAVKIARAFRGTTLYVPDLVKQFRDEAIRRAYDRGESFRSLALKHRITERSVWNVLKRPSMDLPEAIARLLDE